ncbi:MAG TPA: enoyl-CoA hydratase-related protein [Candidatus Xenobia bacterium]|nr:enoyl-CoA hydratase-related protein [Candidatus Xenobia bacterium]
MIHGSDKSFAAGAEISEVSALSGVGALDFSRSAQLFFERLSRSSKPIVAAIQGYCLGGALDLALACHYRIATPEAMLGQPGATLGLITGWGGTQRLPRLIGQARALEMLLRGESMSAPQALTLRLVTKSCPPAHFCPAHSRRPGNWPDVTTRKRNPKCVLDARPGMD